MSDCFKGEYIAYGLVLLAFLVPALLWRGNGNSASRRRDPAWSNMPGVFRMSWGWIAMFEFVLGAPLCGMFPAKKEKYEKWILASALPLTPAKVFTLQAFSILAGVVAGALLLCVPNLAKTWSLSIGVMLALIGWVYPSVALEKYVQWRQTELTRQLPFAIDLIGSAMRAGLEFGAAMRYFEGLKIPGPLTEEFGKVLQQMELGRTRIEAMEEMARRVQVESFTSFVGVVAYGTEIGASISETLMVHGEELRRARFHLAERKAARAPSLMILPMAVFIMPAVFIIVITPVAMKMMGMGLGGH